MINHNSDNKPLYYSTYSFIAQVDGKPMEFVSEEEYEEYIQGNTPISIIKQYFIDEKPMADFRMRIVFYRRKSDGVYLVYRAVQYFRHKPHTELYSFTDYGLALCKYREIGGQ